MPKVAPKNNKWIHLGLLNLVYSFLIVSLAYISKLIIDSATSLNKDFVVLYSSIFLGIIFLAIIFKLIENFIYVRVGINRQIELRRILFQNRLMASISDDSIHTGLLIQAYQTDIANIVSGEVDTYPRVFFEVGRLVFAIISVFFIDWKFLIILISVGILGLIFARIYSKIMKNMHNKVLKSDGKINSFFQESMENIKLIQSYDATDNFIKHYDKKEEDYIINKRRLLNLELVANNILILGSNIIYAICIFYGGYSIASGKMSYGTLLAIIQLMSHIQSPIMSFSAIINRLSLYKTSLERYNEKINITINKIENLNDFSSININNLTFGWDENSLFKNLSFTINKGDIIEIKGHSGIGKTSLFMILLGFLKPKGGSIDTIYNNNNTYSQEKAKTLFSYVAQENILFSGSIRDNFNLLVGECNIEEALKFSNVYDEIMALPNKIDTVLFERGSGLSIGQLQRVMIAIAYAKDRPIFLLDEFTSALDLDNSNIIIDNLKKHNKTIIFISHKNESINPNKIINLEEYMK